MKNRNEQFASEPYGMALKRILAERKISISTLAQKLDLPSRNTIHRVLAGNSKYESAEKLHQRICENQSRLHFREEEMQTLQEALERCRYGEQGYAIRKMVMDLIIRPEHPAPAAPCICCTSTEPAWCGRTLNEVMDALANYAEADIFLFNAPYPQLCDALQRLFALAETGGLHCRVQHVLSSIDDAFVEMQQFIQLRSLLSEPRYTCYRVASAPTDAHHVGSAEQSMIICKRSRAGLRTVDRISFLSDRSFAYCTGLPDDNGQLAQYYAAYSRMLIAQCTCLNPKQDHAQAIANLLALNAEFAQYEQCWSQILIKPDLCVSQIPTEYMMRLIRDSGYLGLSPDSPEIEEFERVHRQRYENFISGKHGYVFIFSESGMRRFMETGRLSDHVPMLPAFTLEERRGIVEGLLRVAEEKAGVIWRMFKTNVKYTECIINHFDEEQLYLIIPKNTDYSYPIVCGIDQTNSVRRIRQYVLKDILLANTLSAEESILRLQAMLTERIGEQNEQHIQSITFI